MPTPLKLVEIDAETITFESFWASYPRRVARKDAQKAWAKIRPEDYPSVMNGLMAYKKSEQWAKDGGQFIPHAATWLNGERWNDELEIETAPVTPAGQVKDCQCQQHENGERCKGWVTFWNIHGTKGNCSRHGPY